MRSYNLQIKVKTFKEGDLVWNLILPMERKSRTYGKWSPTWEGPFCGPKEKFQ